MWWIKKGTTIEFMLSAKRDISAAKRFFKKMMRVCHRAPPRSLNVDKQAAYPDAFTVSKEEKILPSDCTLRRTTYLHNVIGTGPPLHEKAVARVPVLPHV